MRCITFQNVCKTRNGLKINNIGATKPSSPIKSPLSYANAHAANSHYNGAPANDALGNVDVFSLTRYTGFIESPLRQYLTCVRQWNGIDNERYFARKPISGIKKKKSKIILMGLSLLNSNWNGISVEREIVCVCRSFGETAKTWWEHLSIPSRRKFVYYGYAEMLLMYVNIGRHW